MNIRESLTRGEGPWTGTRGERKVLYKASNTRPTAAAYNCSGKSHGISLQFIHLPAVLFAAAASHSHLPGVTLLFLFCLIPFQIELDPGNISLMSAGACGAFIHGLEDEFMGTSMQFVYLAECWDYFGSYIIP